MITYEIKKFEQSKNVSDENLKIVVYSHTSFLEVLNIQIDYLEGKGDLILIINENDDNLTDLYNKFQTVIFYDDSLPYGYRLLNSVKQVPYDYFILIHDNDIAIHIDEIKVKRMFDFLRENNYDRVDFQLAYDFDSDDSHKIDDDGLYFIKSSNTDTANKGYPYNVNPSIWKKDTLVDILNNFGFRDYRTIEHPDTQNYAVKFNIFKLYSKRKYQCGYFICLEPFRYIHITHSQKYLNLSSLPNSSYNDIEEEYIKIINKYNLTKSNKWM
jgi:hypothetical protein